MGETGKESAHSPELARAFLESLQRSEMIVNDREVAAVLAHQDDETLAFTAAIMRIPNCMTVHVTDGAPREQRHWNGHETRAAYAEARNRELTHALTIAGHTGKRESLNVSDQETALHLAKTAVQLADLFLARGITYALTHAYEGGHADHDAVSFAVHAAKKILERRGVNLVIIEAPFYRKQNSKLVVQNFVPHDGIDTIPIELTESEASQKRAMLSAFESQRAVFSDLSPSTTTEWLREAPDYDFRLQPNDGQFTDIFEDSGITPEKWEKLTRDALQELSLDEKR